MADQVHSSWLVETLSPETVDGAASSAGSVISDLWSAFVDLSLAYPWAGGPVILYLALVTLGPPVRLAVAYASWRLEQRARARRAEERRIAEARRRKKAERAALIAQLQAEQETGGAADAAAGSEEAGSGGVPGAGASGAGAPGEEGPAQPADAAVVALQQRAQFIERRKARGLPVDAPSRAAADTAEDDAADDVQADSGKERGGRKIESGRDLLVEWRAFAKRNLMIAGVFSIFINLLMLTIPIYLFQISDRVLSSRSTDTLVLLTIMAVGFIGVLALLDILRRQLLSRIATRLEIMLGGPVLAAIIGGSQTSDQSSVAPLRSLQQVRGFIAGPVTPMLFDGAMAPLYFAAVFLIHPDLGTIAVSAGVLLLLTAFLNQWAVSPSLSKAGVHAAKADANAEALTRNAQVINAMGMLNEGILHWGREQAKALVTQIGAQDRNFWITGFSKFIRLCTQIAMLGWGGYLALNGMITGGTMIAASIIAGRALQPIEGMIEGWRSLVQARGAYGRIVAIIDALQREKERLQLPRPKGKLEIEKLLYLPQGGKEPILNGVDFALEPGESLAILGPSGSGKSTLARILVGCLRPTAGKVRLDSTELRNWDSRQFGEFTGYLPQEVELFPGTIKANISRMREDKPDEDVFEAASFTEVHDLVSRLPSGYETMLEANGAPLSGGQKQRIALARAFFGKPALVVLDEPNANLDANGEQALADTLRNAKAEGVTIVAITQRPALLSSVDKVLVLRNGKQEAFGAPNEVMRHLVKQPDISGAQPAAAETTGQGAAGAA